MFLFCDGFDGHAATADLTKKWGSVSSTSTLTFNSTAGRYGGGAAVFTAFSALYTPIIRTSFDAGGVARLSVGFSFKMSATPAAEVDLLTLTDTNNAIVSASTSKLRITTSGFLRFYGWSNGSPSATGALNVCDNAWHWIEADFYLADSGGFCVVIVDGTTTTINFAGDTISTGSPNLIDRITFTGAPSRTVTIDDVVIYDDIAGALAGDLQSSVNFPLGPCRIPLLKPNGAGSSTDFTASAGSNYQCVDDAAPNNDTDYVASSTAGHDDLYAAENTSLSPATIYGVSVTTVAKYAGTGGLDLAAKTKSSAATETGVAHVLRPAYRPQQTFFPEDPNTSAAWGTAGIDAAEFGFELV